MGSKRRDLEIVYNLVWKHKTLIANDRLNIIGMYDIPSTTLNWDTFKSYLLKNSGSSCADVKVSYVDSDDKEIPIESQADFQLALYSFRKRARAGETITLKLENLAERKKSAKRFCLGTDAEVQAGCGDDSIDSEVPPEWFTKYMRKFKKEMIDEVSTVLINLSSKLPSSQHSAHHSRKSKMDSHKRPRKLVMPLSAELSKSNFEKELYKHSKLESKLENKLEKLEYKTMQIKAKKLAMKVSSDSDVGRGSSKTRLIGQSPCDSELLMNAMAVNSHEATIPHILGGGTYLQQWEVVNSGKIAWTNDTELRFAWGSELLNPVEKKVSCPSLQPGEKGTVSVLLEIPELPGNYECYWHFHHFGRRFGHWLGCQVIVDEPPVKKTLHPKYPYEEPAKCPTPEPELASLTAFLNEGIEKIPVHTTFSSQNAPNEGDGSTLPLTEQFAGMKISPKPEKNVYENNDLNSSDTDNISVLSLSGSNSGISGNYEYVVMPKNGEEKVEEEKIGNANPKTTNETEKTSEETQEMVERITNMNKEREVNILENEDYAYIYYNGEKIPFHKRFLSKEYFETAEKVKQEMGKTETNNQDEDLATRSKFEVVEAPKTSETSQEELVNVETLQTTEINKIEPPNTIPFIPDGQQRMFVFPQNSPGYEVYSTNQLKTYDFENDTSISSDHTYTICENGNRMSPKNRMCSSLNSICNASLPPNLCHHGSCSHYSEGDAENYVSVQMCPCKLNEHMFSGCNAGNCNVHVSTPQAPQSTSSTHTLYDNHVEVPSSAERMQPPRHMHNKSAPENLLSEAAILASTAMSSARNLMSMVVQNGTGKWVNGHWVTENPNSKRENALRQLAEMGFIDRDLNATLLARFNDDVHRVVSELIL